MKDGTVVVPRPGYRIDPGSPRTAAIAALEIVPVERQLGGPAAGSKRGRGAGAHFLR